MMSKRNDKKQELASSDSDANGDRELEAEQAAVQDEDLECMEVESELECLQRERDAAHAQAAEYLDGWQRAQAEFSNYRKRQEAERLQQTQMSNAILLAKILPVLDDVDRAAQTLPSDLRGLTWIDGFFLIQRKLSMVLESEGVKPIEAQGQTFDPLYHEAVTYEEAEGFQEGQIIGEIQRGYTLGDRVIRPAMVRVARAPAVPTDVMNDNDAD